MTVTLDMANTCHAKDASTRFGRRLDYDAPNVIQRLMCWHGDRWLVQATNPVRAQRGCLEERKSRCITESDAARRASGCLKRHLAEGTTIRSLHCSRVARRGGRRKSLAALSAR